LANGPLNPAHSHRTASGLHEVTLQLLPSVHHHHQTYETGDHLAVYPRNADVWVEAALAALDYDGNPHAVIQQQETDQSYPHPTGITLYETLTHCVDLGALPSPAFSRFLTGRQHLDYKRDVAAPRRTALDLLLEAPGRKIPLADFLHQSTPMRPRYYSIASSSAAHPDRIVLTYRPVKYVTTRGVLREGVCTSYMTSLRAAAADPSGRGPTVVGSVRSNPQFRLPETAAGDTPPPLLLLAGGCGVAPIRAFLEHLIHNDALPPSQQKGYGPVYLFLGFRNQADQVYQDLVEEAGRRGLLAAQHVRFMTGPVRCGRVSDAVLAESDTVYELLAERNASAYVCGGARLFGAAVQSAMQTILQTRGGMDEEAATAHLRQMIQDGRYHEDLSD
jgi:sulfite reductase alpha subunit-like flavoprotein